MKKKIYFTFLYGAITSIICFVLFLNFTSCSSSETNNERSETKTEMNDKTTPLNLSIVIDLSDRLIRNNVNPSQVYNDTAIINYFIDYFIKSKGQDPTKCKNKFQILFYPTPSDPNINNLSRDLTVDLSKLPNKDKKKQLLTMKDRIDETLDVIYSKTLEAKKWEGSDIWDFFSNRQIDKLCIKDNYRNIVAILTDGYLFHSNHKIKEGDAYSYVLPQTLQNNGTLISRRNDLNNVEIIMLEVNPYNPNERDKLISVLQNWFLDMGVDPTKLSINEMDIENRTETIIENFLN